MKIDLKLKNSPLKLDIGKFNGSKFEIHVTTLLLILLTINFSDISYSISKVLILILAYLIFEIIFTLNIISKPKKNESLYCLMPFGIIANFESQNKKLMKNKFYSSLIIFIISAIIILYNYFLPATTLLIKTTTEYFLNILCILSLINVLPFFGLPAYTYFQKNIKSLKLDQNIYFKYLPIIVIILINLAYSNIYLSITSFIFLSYSFKEKFLSKTKESAMLLNIKDVYTPIENIAALKTTDNLKKIALNIIRYPQSAFIVYKDKEYSGIVLKDKILESITSLEDNTIASILEKNVEILQTTDELNKALEIFKNTESNVILVKEDEEIKGILLNETAMEFILVNEMIEKIEKQNELFSDDIF